MSANGSWRIRRANVISSGRRAKSAFLSGKTGLDARSRSASAGDRVKIGVIPDVQGKTAKTKETAEQSEDRYRVLA